jgi:hypothetical protein
VRATGRLFKKSLWCRFFAVFSHFTMSLPTPSVALPILPCTPDPPRLLYTPQRKRKSPPLSHTRKTYKKYARDPHQWHALFSQYINESKNNGENMKQFIHDNAPGINYKTFYKRYKKWTSNDSPQPVIPCYSLQSRSLSAPRCSTPGLGDLRGGHNKKWTDEQERQFVEQLVRPVYVETEQTNAGITNIDLKQLAVMNDRKNIAKRLFATRNSSSTILKAGNSWITRMKKEHKLYTGESSTQRQKHKTDKTTAIAAAFIEKVRAAIHLLGPKYVIAMDETFWNLHIQTKRTIKVRGGETKINTAGDPKAGMTTILTIAANGSKLPIMFVAKGKTMDSTAKFKCPLPHIARSTVSGWCRDYIMMDYIDHVIQPTTKDHPCLLILDCYPAHVKFTDEYPPNLHNIQFAYVPEGMTATLSPLDVTINPIIKSTGRRKFRKNYISATERGLSMKGGAAAYEPAVQCCINSFNSISRRNVAVAFERAIGVRDKTENSKAAQSYIEWHQYGKRAHELVEEMLKASIHEIVVENAMRSVDIALASVLLPDSL